MTLFQFPKWTDGLRPLLGIAAVLTPTYIVALFVYGASAETLQVGYAPEQPIPFSHALHAGKLGMDCRYCHNTVESADVAAIPALATCMNCHKSIFPTEKVSPKLKPLHDAWASGQPVRWVKVHDLPEFTYFSHAPHLKAGVSCVECHGRVDQMERVQTVQPLSMTWCLDCHRNPESRLRPREHVFDLGWTTDEDRNLLGARLRQEYGLDPRTDCSTCHR
jgi:hypothetical protein